MEQNCTIDSVLSVNINLRQLWYRW